MRDLKGCFVRGCLYISLFFIMIVIFPIRLFAAEESELSVFEIKDGAIISYTGTETVLDVPEMINGQTVTAIEDEAFKDNVILQSVKLPDTIKVIGKSAFEGCSALKDIKLPETLEIIGVWSFGYCENLENINLPNNLKKIESAAFYGCKKLKLIKMPDSLTEIGTHSFRGCISLNEVIFSSNIDKIPYRAFSHCEALREVSIPEGLVSIDDEAFYCAGLESVQLPDSLESIGESAFYMCKTLSNINFPDSVGLIGKKAFYQCEQLNSITLPKNLIYLEDDTFYGCINIKTINLNNSLTKIGARAFHGCSKIVSLTIPQNIISIGEAAFEGCNKLVEVFNLSDIDLQMGSATNGMAALFAICIHENQEEKSHLQLDENGFLFYNNGDDVRLVNYNGDMSDLTLPDKYNGHSYKINRFAFIGNKDLYELIIPDGITYIGENAFYGCENLAKIYIPKSVSVIGAYAFYNCPDIYKIVYEGSKEDWSKVEIGEANEVFDNWFIRYEGESVVYKEEHRWAPWGIADLFNDITVKIFTLNLVLTLFWGIIFIYSVNFNRTPDQRIRSRKTFIVICCIQWILISGLRANSVGADTQNYMRLFHQHIQEDWSSLLNNFREYLFSGNAVANDYEPGYVLIEKLIGNFTTNEVVYKFIIAIIFTGALGYYIYRNSEDPCMSFIIYDGLLYNMFSLTGYRQTIAVAIGVLVGTEFVKKRKFVPFLITILLASTIHRAILIFILYYFLADKKITRNYVGIISLIVCIGVIFRTQLFAIVKVIFGYEQYAGNYGFAQGTFTFLLAALTVVAAVQYRKIIKMCPHANQYYNGLLLMWLMMPFAMASPTSMRLVYTFGFTLLSLVPLLIRSFRDVTTRRLIYWGIAGLFMYFVYSNAPVYQFFWQ